MEENAAACWNAEYTAWRYHGMSGIRQIIFVVMCAKDGARVVNLAESRLRGLRWSTVGRYRLVRFATAWSRVRQCRRAR